MQGILDRSRCRQTALRATSVGRYYDPQTAQFLSVDPLASITGTPYSYAGDNPLNGTDPLGLDCRNTDSCPPSTSYSQENGYSPSQGHMDNADPTPQNETISSGTSTTSGTTSSSDAGTESKVMTASPSSSLTPQQVWVWKVCAPGVSEQQFTIWAYSGGASTSQCQADQALNEYVGVNPPAPTATDPLSGWISYQVSGRGIAGHLIGLSFKLTCGAFATAASEGDLATSSAAICNGLGQGIQYGWKKVSGG